jgi:hypothetical protein
VPEKKSIRVRVDFVAEKKFFSKLIPNFSEGIDLVAAKKRVRSILRGSAIGA